MGPVVALARAMRDVHPPDDGDVDLAEHPHQTVAGRPPSTDESARCAGLAADGTYTQASLLAMAAQLEPNTAEFGSRIGQGVALDPGLFGP